eukprot:TRINITY_DN395_c0_g1_i2.p1 TRINITY_DN395_c0_g1~~TRINITY_DN395_c0_g1_i2.p1  ORF type:complete len:565 (+),score=204.51 TRINITY_DN395_c0_g1_i2:92-1696(+)
MPEPLPATQPGYVQNGQLPAPAEPPLPLKECSAAPCPRAARRSEWDSPAYEVLRSAGLMRADWRVHGAEELQTRPGNTTPGANMRRLIAALACFPCGVPVYSCCCKTAEVAAGTVQLMEDGRGGFEFLGQGVHYYFDCFLRIIGEPRTIASSGAGGVLIRNGNRTIVEVEQGYVGLAMDMGQPILLPPGLHEWQSDTMVYQETIDLTNHVIRMGPYTLLTVDKGYDAVTQNNGQQQVLEGGAVHLLNHRNWKFEKFITRKIQTDNLQKIEAITGDNVLMLVQATVCWQIRDSQVCAERAAETMASAQGSAGGGGGAVGNIAKLRNDVLKQAEASLSAFIGRVNFSDTISTATAVASGKVSAQPGLESAAAARPGSECGGDMGLLFDGEKLRDAVGHSNEMTARYGVEVLSINIISARPSDTHLMNALAKGAVAAAEAQQYETEARGKARAARIEAQGQADALCISAKAAADADVTRADGALQAAQRLRQEEVSVRLATIQAQGEALKHAKSTIVLGSDPKGLGNLLLANPRVIS